MSELIFVRGPWKKGTKGFQTGVHIIWLIKPWDEKFLNPKIFEEDKQKAHLQRNKMWQIHDETGLTPRGLVFIFTVSLGKTCYHFILKGKENAFCLFHWANDCSLADPAQRHWLGAFSTLLCLKEVTKVKLQWRKWGKANDSEHTAEVTSQWCSLYCHIFDVCSPTHHWCEPVGKENTPVWALRFIFFFKQTRMIVVCICFILPQKIVLTKYTLFIKDYM